MRNNNQAQAQTPPAALTALFAVGMAAAILFAGTWLAGALRQKSGELVVAQVFQQESAGPDEAGGEQRRGKTLQLLQQYLFALADAAIRFESIPKLDTQAFLGIAAAMPDDVTVERIEFEHYDIRLSCRAEHAESQVRFADRLEDGEAFDEVRFTQPLLQADGSWTFEATCSPREKAGKLTLDLP